MATRGSVHDIGLANVVGIAPLEPHGGDRIFTTSVSSVNPHYVAKVERKGRTKTELDQVIEWLTGYDATRL